MALPFAGFPANAAAARGDADLAHLREAFGGLWPVQDEAVGLEHQGVEAIDAVTGLLNGTGLCAQSPLRTPCRCRPSQARPALRTSQRQFLRPPPSGSCNASQNAQPVRQARADAAMSLALSGSAAEGAVVTVGIASPIEARRVRRALSNRYPREQSSCSLQSSAAPSMLRAARLETCGTCGGRWSVRWRTPLGGAGPALLVWAGWQEV